MHYPPLGLEKPMNILEPNLAGVINSVRSTNSPNFVLSGCEMAPTRGGDNGFVTFFFCLFFRFLGQPTGHNFGPIRMVNG